MDSKSKLVFPLLLSIVFFVSGTITWKSNYKRRVELVVHFTSPTGLQLFEIEINTEDLIASNEMNSNCYDILFSDSGSAQDYEYWIESGCNTQTTTIWIKANLISGANLIYMYYHNPSQTTRRSKSKVWSNKFGFLSNSYSGQRCYESSIADWTNLNGVHIVGSVTEDDSTVRGSVEHYHSQNTFGTVTTTQAIEPGTVSSPIEVGGWSSPKYHFHWMDFNSGSVTSSVSNTPPSYQLYVCMATSSNTFPGYLPLGVVMMFPNTDNVTGMTPLDGANKDQLYIKTLTSGPIGILGGSTSHRHEINLRTANEVWHLSDPGNGRGCSGGSTYSIAAIVNPLHEHYGSCYTTEDDYSPPYHLVHLQNVSSTTVPFSKNMITIMKCTDCSDIPFGWERYSALDNKFLRATDNASRVTESNGGTDHTHNTEVCTWGTSDFSWDCDSLGGHRVALSTHYHDMFTVDLSTGTADGTLANGNPSNALDANPVHRRLVFIKRMDVSSNISSIEYTHDVKKCSDHTSYETGLVCSGYGECSDHETCTCHKNYYGKLCNVTKCDQQLSNVTSTCTEFGICWPFDICTCQNGYFGESCNVTTCNGVYSNDSNICSEHGTCWPKNICACPSNSHYFGSDCNHTWCNGNPTNISEGYCSNRGSCWPYEHCNCESNYFGESCNITMCNGYYSNDTLNVCTNSGFCLYYDHCTCDFGYFGESCNITMCNGYYSNDTLNVCTNKGYCLEYERCSCDVGYFGEDCNVTTCFGVFSNDTSEVCTSDGQGICWPENICQCFPHYHGILCNETTCNDVWNNDTTVSVCSSHGRCELHDHCDCSETFFGISCEISTCFDVLGNSTSEVVCSNHGSCIDYNTCVCSEKGNNSTPSDEYFGEECEFHYCFGILNNDTENVCFGHGECIDHEICNCSNRYNGTNCTEFFCFDIHYLSIGEVCTGHGECTDTDVCVCLEDYGLDTDCSVWDCFGTLNNETDSVCSGGHGECSYVDHCSCYPGYGDVDCGDFICGNYRNVEKEACGAKGTCIGFDECLCDAQYYFNATSLNVVCTHCPNGTHFEGEEGGEFSDCVMCPPGTYSTVENDDGCIACPEGTYSDDERSRCTECPIGTYNAHEGRSSIDHCLPCPRGYYGNVAGARWIYGCVPCPQGTRNPNLGCASFDDCIPCGAGEVCPVGSVESFPLTGEDLKREITYEDLGITQVMSGEVTYEFKIIVMSVVFAICISTLCLVCVSSNSCFLCEKKKDPEKNPKQPAKKNRHWLCMLCPTFRTFDWYYSMEHDVGEGESKVKMSTQTGGCFSIVAVSLFSTFLIWSVSDFVYGSKKINTSADFYQANETNQIQGDMQYIVEFYGSFDNCSLMERESSLVVDGLGMDDSVFSCATIIRTGPIGCSCRFDCMGCLVKKSEMLVQLSMVHGGEYVRMIRYTLVLPSFNEESYNVTGTFFEGNGTCDTVGIDISLYPRRYEVQSNWNLILGLLDLEQWGKKTFFGIGAGILSIEANVVHHPGLESVPGKTPFSFYLKLSNFEQIVEEYFPQTLLNFIAQIFSLIGVSVSIVGIFFGKVESFQSCCSSFCSCFFVCGGKSKKVSPAGEEPLTLKSLMKEIEEIKSSSTKEIEMLKAWKKRCDKHFAEEFVEYEVCESGEEEELEKKSIIQTEYNEMNEEENFHDVELKKISDDDDDESSSSLSEQEDSNSESGEEKRELN